MYCKLITENDCAVKAVLSCTPVEFLIINKAIARCSNDEFYTESDRRTMVLMGEAMKNFEQVEVADSPQTDCDTCKHYKLACELFSEVCKYEPTTQTETQNSNLTFDTPQTDADGSEVRMLCKDCEYFKIEYQPIKGFDFGRARCTKYDVITDFRDERKFKWLSCEDRPKKSEVE